MIASTSFPIVPPMGRSTSGRHARAAEFRAPPSGRTARGRPPAPIGVGTVWAMQLCMLVTILLRCLLS